ncbi:right-handed parallel beta-helix repeat-containing protein [Clostridium pasteurianum]|uniref:right-handed parallel beta-helix repeat-containing protein n=1 Tax=Clostridium pasteurianum TaxID=1501 RepID=UPI002260856E|nr:right-handed parallel beta-helix repeat-containing protein [Clostridium pasteurianum]UZW14949.1 right-handed parallel beta-helix repeat-containing protein [Clostridium pasteurianum]
MKKKHKSVVFMSMILILLVAAIITALYIEGNSTKVFFIAPNGKDSNLGTKNKPLATLEGAKKAILKFKGDKKNKLKPVTVYLRGGTYYRTDTFNIDGKDFLGNQASITYEPYKSEKVIITGGITLDKNKLTKVSDGSILNKIIDKKARNHILEYDLKADNIAYGDTSQNIMYAPELFFNNTPLTLARWPNESYDLIGNVVGNTKDNYSFHSNNTRPSLWQGAEDVWLFGYWYQNWAGYTVKMDSVDTKNQLITFKQNIDYGIKSNQRYFAFNLLEELDKPGEWYFDRTNGKIYMYPPSSMDKGDFYISQLNKPFIVEKNTSNICFKGITFEGSRNTAIIIDGGKSNTISGCTIRNISKNAVDINGGEKNGVQSCDIYNAGAGGINIFAGDRNKLISAENYADNNNIYNYARIERTYKPAINLSGVGNIASHNNIHDAPHTAILLSGNNHTIEYNNIYSVAKETEDVGAIYTGRDWTYRGNVIRYNYIHDIEDSKGKVSKMGVYLDDCMSSAEVYGNVFFNVSRGILAGGGRDNKIYNNIFALGNESIIFDDRGLTWNLDELFKNLSKVPYKSTIWKKQYPDLYKIMEDSKPGVPVGNTVTDNALYMIKKPEISEKVIENGKVSNNILISGQPDFIINRKLDFKEFSKAAMPVSNFKNIPISNMGIYKDQYSKYRNLTKDILSR